MPTGGSLTIETTNVHLDERYADTHFGTTAGPHVLLAISDTGTGMDEATRTRVFEPFFTTKTGGRGTGLGLATVFGIVKQMGGSIWVYSEPGQGTSFKIYLPAHPDLPAVARDDAEPDPAHLRGSETILVVEDDDLVRAATRRLLEEGGYRVLQAGNGAVAVDILRAGTPRVDLILSDVVMPGMNASELLTAARGLSAAPILFMSGYTDNTVINHGILEGQIPFLPKPFTRQALLLKVREVLGQSGAGQGAPPVRTS
jgi:CheY-like chemotaxis protein